MPTELRFVTAEEAAKFPRGCAVLKARKNGKHVFWERSNFWESSEARGTEFTHFARLPDSLPEVERNG